MNHLFSRKKLLGMIIVLCATVFMSNIAVVTAATNLIGNPSVEQASSGTRWPVFFAKPAEWNKSDNLRNITYFYYPVTGYNSSKAVKVQVSYYRTDKEGWYFNNVNISPSVQYSFSDYYISTYLQISNFPMDQQYKQK